jgi:hypothetical protein
VRRSSRSLSPLSPTSCARPLRPSTAGGRRCWGTAIPSSSGAE